MATLYVVLLTLDALLGEATKQRLKDETLRLWVWLDNAKKVPLKEWIRQRFWWFATPAIAAEIMIMAYISRRADFPNSLEDAIADFFFLVLPPVLALLLGLLNIRIILAAKSWWLGLLWACLFLAIAFIPLILLNQAVPYVIDVLPQLSSKPPSLWPWLVALLFVAGYVMGISFMAVMLVFWISAAIAWLSIYGLTALLHVTEFVVRRMAESKQALAVLAGIFGALALLLQWAITPLP